jgi:hypothetical protein
MVSYEVDVSRIILNKNVNKIDFVSPSADCSVVLWWGSLEGAIKMMIGTKTDFNTGSISMYELLLNSTYSMIHSISSIIYRLLYMILYSIQWQASHDNWS